jgi:hypothetical protein
MIFHEAKIGKGFARQKEKVLRKKEGHCVLENGGD